VPSDLQHKSTRDIPVVAVPATPATATVRTPARTVAGRGWRRWRGRIEIALFVAPALALYVCFVLVPMGMAAFYSVFDWSGLGPLDDFVGLGNYSRALQDPTFRGAVEHNVTIVVLSLLLQLPAALGLALLLNRKMRGRAVLRTVFFAPYVLSEVITAVTWVLILQPDGFADAVLRKAGLGGLVHLWLADRHIVLYTMFLVITWKYIGFAIILFLAGLQGIPKELHEAAAIDGATPWKVTRYITLPLLGPTIRIWVFLSIIGSLQLFDLVWIMTLGGPANSSTTMATYIIDHGFRRSQFGYGSAVAMILFFISFAVALVYQRYVLRRDTEGAMTRMAG
jgi:raffinose/stachyose/melibiose transport system permease protein